MKHELTPIRTLIIDPDPASRAQLEEVLKRNPAFEVVGTSATGLEGISSIQSFHPDLIFVEIELPDMTGFELLHKISPAMNPQYVFLSSSEEYALKAFEYFAFDYLLRPFTNERLQLTLIKLREQIFQKRNEHLQEKLNALFRYINQAKPEEKSRTNGKNKLLPVKMSGRIYFIHPDHIEYIEAAGYYIEVFANGKKHLLRQSLTQLDEFLDTPYFLRIHRSVIINLHFLKEIIRDGANDFSVKMANDATFKISRSYKAEVFDKIGL